MQERMLVNCLMTILQKDMKLDIEQLKEKK